MRPHWPPAAATFPVQSLLGAVQRRLGALRQELTMCSQWLDRITEWEREGEVVQPT